MKGARIVTVLGTAAAIVTATPCARGDDAIELRAGADWYAQRIGEEGGGAGTALEAAAGWRVRPRLTLGLFGTAASLGPLESIGSARVARTVGAGLEARYYLEPAERPVAIWLGVGAGWRSVWEPRGAPLLQRDGVDLVRLQLGFDLGLTRAVAVGPVFGASAWAAFQGDAGPAVFLFAGVAARFDVITE